MDHHIERLLLFMTAVFPVHPLALHHANKKSHEFLRLTRSATTNGSLDLIRKSSDDNCYESTCVLNEQFCSESIQGCDMCRYEHGECTADWDCFQFCSDRKAEEICGGPQGSIETTVFPWWSYLILVIFIISFIINAFFVTEILQIRKKCTLIKIRKSNSDTFDETLDMLSNSEVNSLQTSRHIRQTTLPKVPSAPPYTDEPKDPKTQTEIQDAEKRPKTDNEKPKICHASANFHPARPDADGHQHPETRDHGCPDTFPIGNTVTLETETPQPIDKKKM
ncbi:hypothetical protein CHS0354_009930 [Potamilus streckersoni]|uniref:Uncharacterized protein n=1 Tax=Potamilus streckersoni TaxID=2493646 RepID=A0AAE0WC66_9BIVA|nr:hypothetical protein CHS0354_009930 [Potamilus streckersoni]